MKKTLGILLIGLLSLGNAWAGSFSTGAIDTVARSNAATAQATANAAEPTASLPTYLASPPAIGTTQPAAGSFSTLASPNVNITGGSIIGILNRAGELFEFAGATCPTGALLVSTATVNVSRTTYANLFAAIGTTWGAGDGSTTFGLPAIGADQVPVQANANVGSATVGAVIAHTHYFSTYNGNISSGTGGYFTSADNYTFTGNVTVSSTGGTYNLAAGIRVLHCIRY